MPLEDNEIIAENTIEEDIPEEEIKEEEIKEDPVVEVPKETKKEEPKKTVTEKPITKKEEVPAAPVETPVVEEPIVVAEEPKVEEPKLSPLIAERLVGAVPNNGKFKIEFESLSGPIKYLNFFITNLDKEIHKNISVSGYSQAGSTGGGGGFGGFTSEGQYKSGVSLTHDPAKPPKTIDVYVFIDFEGATYYEKFLYTVK